MDIIRHPIKPEKGKAWHFKSHQYFTKQASNVVREYIENFSKKGDLILDPFAGTGVTGIEALTLKRKIILLDINPLACFIAEQTIRKVDTDKLAATFYELESKVKPKLEEYYNLSDIKIEKINIAFWYPKNIRLPKNSDFQFVEDLYTKRQLLSYAFLFDTINKIKNLEMREIMKFVFSATMSKVNLTYWDNKNRGPEGGGSSIFGAYRYHKPSLTTELNIWKNFKNRFGYIIKGKKDWNRITNGWDVNKNFKIINDSIQNLDKHVDPNSIDYIYTDPPYGGNIAYLDLSTMWNVWLGFEVNEDLKKEEIIEGGDLDKSQNEYEEMLSKSFISMSNVLKKDKWLSLVFAHKKLEFWNVIIDSCEENGLEFKGSTFQPTNNSSIHYKKNPANVLCSQRIANFQKTFKTSPKENPDDLKDYIINEIERACLEENGAGLDKIYNYVLDKLHNSHLIHEAKKKGYLKLDRFLGNNKLFIYEPSSNLYYVKASETKENPYIKDYFHNKDELKIYLKSILTKKGIMTISEIHKELFEVYAEEKRFPIKKDFKDLEDILKEIAYKSKKSNKWTLNPGEQIEFTFEEVLTKKLVKIKREHHTHTEIIFRLIQIGNYLGFNSWIGKREQSIATYLGTMLKEISIKSLPFENIHKHHKEKIEQIDVIWFDKLSNPRYAFEIEESTSMNSGIERFTSLLEADMSPAKKLFIVSPKSRKNKLEKTFRKESTFIGHPYYMENKVGFILKEDLEKFYNELAESEEYFSEAEFLRLKHTISID